MKVNVGYLVSCKFQATYTLRNRKCVFEETARNPSVIEMSFIGQTEMGMYFVLSDRFYVLIKRLFLVILLE